MAAFASNNFKSLFGDVFIATILRYQIKKYGLVKDKYY